MSFEGEIGEIDLVQRLVELGSEQFTGAIRFESDGIIKIIYFKDGDVLSASTNDRTDAVDEILLRANKVTREHVKQALAKRKESETLGDALLGLGFITRKELTWARRVQVIGILRSIIGWKTGSYTIVADYLPKREEGTLFPLSQIIVELVVTDTDRTKSEQAMESGNAIFEKAPNFDDAFRRLGLNEDAEQIVAQIDGNSTAADVAARSGKDIFNVYKLLEALRLLKLVIRADKPPVKHEVYGDDAWDVENPDFTVDDVAPTIPLAAVEAPRVDSATMEIPALHVDSPASSVWDDPADDEQFSATEVAPPPITPAAEPQWGFDEAQIEAARRAAVPLHSDDEVPTSALTSDMPPPEPRKSSILTPLLLLLLVAAGAYGGWNWWQKRQEGKPAAPVATTKPVVPPPVTAVTTNTSSAVTASNRNAGVSPAGPAKPALSAAEGSSLPAVTKPQLATTSAAPVTTTAVPPSIATTKSTPKTTTTAPPRIAATTTTAPAPRIAAATPPKPKPRPTPVDSATHLERTATGATITNASTPSTTTFTDATRAKYDGMATDFAAQKGGNYTLQFELVCETASVTRALNEGGAKVWFVRTSYRNRPCYRVFWGRFDSSADANAASKQLPASLGSAPVVVKIPR
jgi:septal ring-binding cell division protein DamX